ncbi:MAG: T9SS type A sorting domain-containing protein [Flavobacteriales bacterium]|nr:T9SS type A sorting domain-containing protein [Flavobacteriales bacterium]
MRRANLVRRYRLLDINGRTVGTGNPAAQRFTIERNGLVAGTYLVELEVENGRIVRKLMLD